jgi:hypothetical protein
MRLTRTVAVFAVAATIALANCPLQASDPVGRWSGTWTSCTNGHSGKLCATVSQKDCCTYQVTFCGTFFGVVPFAYSVPMTAIGQGPNGERQLYGEAELPVFGKFHCRADISPCCFVASYWSAEDQGKFTMRRK